MRIGAHVPAGQPLSEAAARGADVVQLFLSNPQSWKAPTARTDADDLRSSEVPIYVHAPYLVNLASPNNRIRIPSRKILADTCRAAKAIGAAGVIVHGGHVGDEEETEAAMPRWQKALEGLEVEVPILIENTAGGSSAVARRLDGIARLWEAVGHLGVGLVVDTCHAWSAGEDLTTLVERARAATGRVDLVHCNDSRDPFGSGRDRHAPLGEGEIPLEQLIGVARAAAVPVIVETPGDAPGQAADIALLRSRL